MTLIARPNSHMEPSTSVKTVDGHDAEMSVSVARVSGEDAVEGCAANACATNAEAIADVRSRWEMSARMKFPPQTFDELVYVHEH